jgi:hypothetical protein
MPQLNDGRIVGMLFDIPPGRLRSYLFLQVFHGLVPPHGLCDTILFNVGDMGC